MLRIAWPQCLRAVPDFQRSLQAISWSYHAFHISLIAIVLWCMAPELWRQLKECSACQSPASVKTSSMLFLVCGLVLLSHSVLKLVGTCADNPAPSVSNPMAFTVCGRNFTQLAYLLGRCVISALASEQVGCQGAAKAMQNLRSSTALMGILIATSIVGLFDTEPGHYVTCGVDQPWDCSVPQYIGTRASKHINPLVDVLMICQTVRMWRRDSRTFSKSFVLCMAMAMASFVILRFYWLPTLAISHMTMVLEHSGCGLGFASWMAFLISCMVYGLPVLVYACSHRLMQHLRALDPRCSCSAVMPHCTHYTAHH